jgi:elongator complex protein 1
VLDEPINVGWGSKQTQFHGSLGKSAAQSATAPLVVGISPDDDGMPRISWRNDGAAFVVSSISPRPNGADSGSGYRTLRVYDRDGALQSTSEAVPGLEHILAWRPTGAGALIAGTQRFDFPGGGAGKPGRHDLVFFERNGLRHGEFGVRPPAGAVTAGDAEGNLKWGYRVREALWNASADVLALWLEATAGDIGWSTCSLHVRRRPCIDQRISPQFSCGLRATTTGSHVPPA